MSRYSLAPSTIKVVALTGQSDFTIPFEYLARKFVILTLIGRDRKVLVINTDYRFVSKTVISLNNPTPEGYDALEIRRETSATERLVDFHDGSILRAYDLNLSQIQTLHVAEEARDLTADTIGVNDDGDLDARGRKIVNLADGREGTNDAANMKQLREYDTSTLNNRDKAIEARIAAEDARDKTFQARDLTFEARDKTFQARDIATAASDKAENEATASANSAAESEASYQKIVPLEASTVNNANLAEQSKDIAESARDVCLNVRDSIGALPVGSIVIFGSTNLPAGYLWLNGDTFDVTAYPALGVLYPNGILPDFRKYYLKGGSEEVEMLKKKGWALPAHSHRVDLRTSTFDHGVKSTTSDGNHTHTISLPTTNHTGYTYINRLAQGDTHGGFHSSMDVGSRAAGNHQHSVSIGTHYHDVRGNTLLTGSGTSVETDHVFVVFAIKAAGSATNEDLINVSKYEERLRTVENNSSKYLLKKNPKAITDWHLAGNAVERYVMTNWGGLIKTPRASWINNRTLRLFSAREVWGAIRGGVWDDVVPSNSLQFDEFRIYYSLRVSCTSRDMWYHVYTGYLPSLNSTNIESRIAIPYVFSGHTNHNTGAMYYQLVPRSENGGFGYIEISFPTDIKGASDFNYEVRLSVEHIFAS